MKPAERMTGIQSSASTDADVAEVTPAGVARTGGALIILGSTLLVLGIFFRGSIETLFRMFPTPILGVILLLAGAQLAWGPGAAFKQAHRLDRVVILSTAAVALWNVGVAFVVGLVFDYAARQWSPHSGDAR